MLFRSGQITFGVIGVTDANGTIVFNSVPPRDTRLRVSAEGYLPAAIALPADSDAPLVVALAAAPR